MNIPPIYSVENPAAPPWTAVDVSARELEYFRYVIVMIAAVDERTGELEALGSGFVINADGEGVVATASHVIVDWVNRISPRPGNYATGLEDPSEEFNRRLGVVWERKLLRILFSPPKPARPRIVIVEGVYLGLDPRDRDAALLFFPFPRDLWKCSVAVLPLDTDPIAANEPVVLAGYAGMKFATHFEGGQMVLDSEHRLIFRACRVELRTEQVGLTHGKRPMLRANVPLEHGMSGGPLVRVRQPLGQPSPIIGAPYKTVFTASGINSSGWFPEILLGEASEGISLVTPIEALLDMPIRSPHGQLHLRKEIEAQRFPSYAKIRDDLIAGRHVARHP